MPVFNWTLFSRKSNQNFKKGQGDDLETWFDQFVRITCPPWTLCDYGHHYIHYSGSSHIHRRLALLYFQGLKPLWKLLHWRPLNDCIISKVHSNCSLEKIKKFWARKSKNIVFWINIFYAGVMICIYLLMRPDFFAIYDGFARVDRCLGDPNNNWGMNSTRTQIKIHTICKILVKPSNDDYFAYTIYILRNCMCWPFVVFHYLATWNVFEMVVYWRIFAFMSRWEIPQSVIIKM